MVDQLSKTEREALDAWDPMQPPVGFVDRVLVARARPRKLVIAASVLVCAAALALAILSLWPAAPAATPIAVVVRSTGALELQRPEGPWQVAKIGSELFVGDAVRTAEEPAALRIAAGAAELAMSPHTLLRFGGSSKQAALSVELGAVELTGTGNYALAVGEVRLRDSTVRIIARGTTSDVELLVGNAQLAMLNGELIELEVGQPLDLRVGVAVIVSADAAVIVPPPATGITIDVAGKRAEIQPTGATTWTELPTGAGPLAPGNRVRAGAATTVTLATPTGTHRFGGGSRFWLTETSSLSLELGGDVVTTTAETTLDIPKGAVVLAADSEARVELDRSGANVRVVRGSAKLVGETGGELAMTAGEHALVKDGVIRQTRKVPDYFDLRVEAGGLFTVHDPRGTAAVQFGFGGKCPNGGSVEMDHDPQFRTAFLSTGKDAANLFVDPGAWRYRVRCMNGKTVATGQLYVRRDSGTRPLPKLPPVNPIDADGRNYRISYQSVIPTVAFRASGTGSSFRLHLASAGTEQTFDSKTATIRVPGSKLAEQTYTFWFDRDGVRDAKVSTLTVDFDQTAPQVYIESPKEGAAWGTELTVRGAVLPGWVATIDGVTIPIDPSSRRFTAKVGRPAGRALAIKLTHPQRGTHYYLRRSK